MLLHAAHASKTWTNIVMSPDTDVFVLALSFCSHINANLYFHTVKGRESQITDLSKLHSHLGQEKCDALVGPFSGCDSQATWFKSGRCSERDLPPNQDSLHKYIQRASNQAAVHRRSLECYPDPGSSMRWGGLDVTSTSSRGDLWACSLPLQKN